MSETVTAAVAALQEKMDGQHFDGTAKFVIEDKGAFMVRGSEVFVGDDDAEVTLTADQDTFQQIFEGDLNPTSAFMGGRLKIDGDMSKAMQLAGVLA